MFEKILLLLILYSKFLIVISWKPTVDYCKVQCKNKAEHTACNCKIIPPRELYEEGLKEFREEMVNVHNHYRNKIASGGESDQGYPPAANMMAVSYNLELEYIAKCHAGKFDAAHDKCRKMADLPSGAGQNIAGNLDISHLSNNATGMAWRWYNELNYVKVDERKNFIKEYNKKYAEGDKLVGHFSQFVWWSHKFVGCARVHNDKYENEAWRSTLICNYGGASIQDYAANIPGKPIYKEGPQCSACPGNTTCHSDSDYPALCGTKPKKQEGKDKVPLGEKPSRTVRIYQNKLLLMFFFLLLNLSEIFL